MNLTQFPLVKQATAVGFDSTLVGAQLFQHAKAETRRPRWLHIGPGNSLLGIEPDLDLLVLPFKHSLHRFEIDRCVHGFPSFHLCVD